jgi:TDG/mug DNA glycosylase family protein
VSRGTEVDRPTVAAYEVHGEEWAARRHAARVPEAGAAAEFAARLGRGWRADLGCGPGWAAAHLDPGGAGPVLALDAAASMLAQVPALAPEALRVRADLEALPLRRGSLAGAWAYRSYVHVRSDDLPLALGDLHRALAVGGRARLRVLAGRGDGPYPDDDLPGRCFARWQVERLVDVVQGAGFDGIEATTVAEWIDVEATRARTLADTVGPGMRLLLVGLNPSPYAADAGVGFARPGNRFWPAALGSGIVARDRDPVDALRAHGVGMTDLVKRPTASARELSPAEYQQGARRVGRLVAWLAPAAVCFVGLSGYRAAVDRSARTGWQPAPFGGAPTYVMPNPSGANAHTTVADLADHLRAAYSGPPPGRLRTRVPGSR